AEEELLEEVLLASREDGGRKRRPHPGPVPAGEGAEPPPVDAGLAEVYLERLAAHVPARLNGRAVLMDAGNGAAFLVGPEALRRAGAVVTAICDRPDGRNINAGCGALHPEGMAARTREAGASMGVAFDGDADRAIFSDETGRILDGDDVLWIVARDWKRRGLLAEGGVVGTVMSNYGLEAALGREGIAFRRSAVGDRNVARLMEESRASIGGETSGHVIFPSSPAGDGIQTSLVLASITAENGGPLSRLADLEKTPQALRNVRVARRVPLEDAAGISRAVARAEDALNRRGRVFLRYSGTEPLLRILVEGLEEREVMSIADDLEAAARAELA
ncbi:MAG TPA: phosphoglucosamine mutase, partial [Thermoanaerobaculia bacterium]|nr:phosphoglucosamine mutase [Thermoanaerobaculia bacterium]